MPKRTRDYLAALTKESLLEDVVALGEEIERLKGLLLTEKVKTGPVPTTGYYFIEGIDEPKYCLAGRHPHKIGGDNRVGIYYVSAKWTGPFLRPEEIEKL